MKRYTKLFITALLVMAVTLLAGCSAAGNGYFNTAKEVTALDHYAFDGTMQMGIDMDGFYDESQMTEADKEAIDMLKNMQITYVGQYDSQNTAYHFDMDMNMGKYKVPMEFYMDNNKMLVSTESLMKMLSSLGADQSEIDATKAALGKTEWLNVMDMENVMGDVLGSADMVTMTNTIYSVLSYFNEHSFKNYDPGCFSGSNSQGYTLTVSDSNMKNIMTGFVKYIKDNHAAINNDIDANKDAIDSSIFASLGMDSAALKNMVAEIKNNNDANNMNAVIDQTVAMLKGTNLTSTIKKTGSGTYTQIDNGTIVMNDLTAEGTSIALTMKSTINYDGNKDASVKVPTENINTVSKIAEGLKPTEIEGTFYMDDQEIYLYKYYDASLFNTYDVVNSEALIRNNFNYFPMRQIAEMFGETVVWEKATGDIYVSRDGKKIDMSGFIKDNRTYVKLRDFEKLGYTIDYVKDPEFGGIATFTYSTK